MAELTKVIKERRSIRNYEEKDVSEELIMQILESVKWAPSWANTQCWEIVVVRDQEIKNKLKETIMPGNPGMKTLTTAPVVLAICGRLKESGFYSGNPTTKFGDWFMFDLGIVSQNISLKAHDLGLGTLIIGLFDHEKAKLALGVPDNNEIVALIPVGYPAKTPSAPKRREVKEFSHLNKFGQKIIG
ncbi:MAG: nitroreductase family protein [Desulfobacterales bacterium]|nr:nitroreductase family protein [Desulfobacterales bacterium]